MDNAPARVPTDVREAAHEAPRDPIADIIAGAATDAIGEDPTPGTAVGQFRLRERIGSGGSGVVFRAEQTSPRRAVAVKLLHPHVVGSHATFEAEALGRLSHPGIAQVIEAGTADVALASGSVTRAYLAMELVDGLPMTAFARVHRLRGRERLDLLTRAAAAILHAHERGVVHGDLKPGNILVTTDRGVRVLDFGVAWMATMGHERGPDLAGGVAFVSPPYAAPELVAGRSRPGVASDLFSLGVIATEVLAAHTPDAGAPVRELRAALRACRLPYASRSDVARVIASLLDAEPGRRPSSAADVIEVFGRAATGAPRAPSSAVRSPRYLASAVSGWAARRPATSVLAAALAAVVTLSAVRGIRDDARIDAEASAVDFAGGQVAAAFDMFRSLLSSADADQAELFARWIESNQGDPSERGEGGAVPPDPNGAIATLVRALVLEHTGRPHDALAMLQRWQDERAERASPSPRLAREASMLRARCLVAVGRFDEASEFLSALAAGHSGTAHEAALARRAAVLLANTATERGDPRAALEVLGPFTTDARNGERDPAMLAALAGAYRVSGDLREAESILREAISNPGAPPAGFEASSAVLEELARVLSFTGRPLEAHALRTEIAVQARRRFHARHPELFFAELRLARNKLNVGKLEQAESLYREILAAPNAFHAATEIEDRALTGLVDLYRRTGDNARLESALLGLIDARSRRWNHPDHQSVLEARLELGRIRLADAGSSADVELARELLDAAVREAGPVSSLAARAHDLVAASQARSGDAGRAFHHATVALEIGERQGLYLPHSREIVRRSTERDERSAAGR